MIITTRRDFIEIEAMQSDYIIYTCVVNGWGRVTGIKEYLDFSTGEILLAKDLHINKISSQHMLERMKRLDKLQRGTRDFANFVLKFRNRANGFLQPIEVLIKWYADLYDKKPYHVRRCIDALIKGGILLDEISLDKIFMMNNPDRSKSDSKGDPERARILYDILRLEKRIG